MGVCDRIGYGLLDCLDTFGAGRPKNPCWICSSYVVARLNCLASNLAVAGGLCEAFRRGIKWRSRVTHKQWRPGHALTAPTPDGDGEQGAGGE